MENGSSKIALAGLIVATLALAAGSYPTWREKNFFLAGSLDYRFNSYDCSAAVCHVELLVQNKGFVPELDVEVQIPNASITSDEVEYVNVPYTLTQKTNGSVINLGTLHPNDAVLIYLRPVDRRRFDVRDPQFRFKVASRESRAAFSGTAGKDVRTSGASWGWFGVAYALLVFYTIYSWVIEPEMRRRRLVRELGSIEQKLEELRRQYPDAKS